MSERGLKGEGDRFLIDAIRRGDQDACRQLVDRFSGRLAACAARKLAGSGVDAEDAVQETFVGLFQSLDRLGELRSLEAYLFRILHNKIADLAGRRPEAHGLKQVPLRGPGESGAETPGHEPVAPVRTPSSYLRREEAVEVRNEVLADVLEEAISDLKEERSFRDLKVLELLFYCGWRGKEAAAAAGTSEPTVTRIRAAALEKLARLAARHPRFDRSLDILSGEEDVSDLIRSTWRGNLLSCLKRSTIGAYALGALEGDWADYVAFHIGTAGCEVCAANLEDLKSEGGAAAPAARDRLFASSIGFLRKLKK